MNRDRQGETEILIQRDNGRDKKIERMREFRERG